MREEWTILLLTLNVCLSFERTSDTDVQYYTKKWLVHVPLGEEVAKEVARINNMKYGGPDLKNDGFYYMVQTELPEKTSSHNEDITKQLNNHELITTATQEAVKARSYRGVVQPRNEFSRNVKSRINYFAQPQQNDIENDGEIDDGIALDIPIEGESNYKFAFNDDKWPEMWYLQDFRKNSSQPVLDMNIVPVYFELNITGINVNVTVPDDGLEYTHPELIQSFNPDLSWNYIKDNANVMPSPDGFGGYGSHGTRCAGEIAMRPNNRLCGVGIAYGASVGGVKFLDNESTDAREAKVLKHALEYVSIYSNSWGPADTGTVMEPLTTVVQTSLSKGIHEGRDGKGAIYVFAAGNGKADGDNCACDGYVNSIYTIVIASCDDSGHVTHYSERCTSILATAYSGSGLEKNVLTSDVGWKCTDSHTGTSAAAPLVSGIIALALSANPELTYRDIIHLIAWTSQVAPLSDNFGWNRNWAGFLYSMDFGFGLVNAYQLVRQAQNWTNVPEMSSCGIRMPKVRGFPVSRNSAARISVYSNGCRRLSGEVRFIEYVQLVVTMTYPKRGDIQIAMRSPLGTECHVLESRPNDFNPNGLNRWTFSILAFWGESPRGNFTIDVFDTTGDSSNKGEILEMTLSIHGTKDPPKIYENGPRPYDAFQLAKPGDEPRFLDLYAKSVKSSRKRHVKKGQRVPDVTNIPTSSNYEESKRRVKNFNNMNENEMNDLMMKIEQEAERQEELALPVIMSNIMNSFANNFIPF